MDTRLKKYRYSGWIKLAASVICIAGLLTTAYGCLKGEYFEAALEARSFMESELSVRPLEELYRDVRTAVEYESVEKIKAGSGIFEEQLVGETNMLSDERRQEIQRVTEQYDEWLSSARSAGNGTEAARLEKERNERIAQLNTVYDQKVASVKERLINERLQEYLRLNNELAAYKGMSYTVLFADGSVFSNEREPYDAERSYPKLPLYVCLNGQNITGTGTLGDYRDMPSDGSIVYIGMTQERFNQEKALFESSREYGRMGIYEVAAGAVMFLASVVYLIYAAGRRPDSDEVELIWTDRVYLDVALAIAVTAIGFLIVAVYQLGSDLYPKNMEMLCLFSSLLITLAGLIGITVGTGVVKRLKRKEFWRHTLIGGLFIWVFGHPRKMMGKLREQLKSGPLALRTSALFLMYGGGVVFSIIITVLIASSAGFIGVPLGLILFFGLNAYALQFVLGKVTAIGVITAGTERIRAGELSHRIPMNGEPVTDTLAENINMIAEGLNAAVENEVKAERLKAELVTNVSHDLKTPLTSIITYVDLLKTEGVCSENAPRYLEVLDQKSQRLKSLTEDLFEAAKASSGNMTYTLEKLDVTDLITQGLGELSDKVVASGLDFKISSPKEKIYVMGDGKLLWRVIENLLSNVFKYALPNSRVYLETGRMGETVVITLKNISALPLNIHPDELMERFKRGDESRSSEGSGLGLSIARSLTELQGGTFGITIDGDLFKAEVALPASKE